MDVKISQHYPYEQKWVVDQFLPDTYLFRSLVSIIHELSSIPLAMLSSYIHGSHCVTSPTIPFLNIGKLRDIELGALLYL